MLADRGRQAPSLGVVPTGASRSLTIIDASIVCHIMRGRLFISMMSANWAPMMSPARWRVSAYQLEPFATLARTSLTFQ